jgi:hypothetical protein
MAKYTRVERVETTVRFTLATPTNAVEVDKAVHDASREVATVMDVSQTALWDDALTVTVEDNLIVISYQKDVQES